MTSLSNNMLQTPTCDFTLLFPSFPVFTVVYSILYCSDCGVCLLCVVCMKVYIHTIKLLCSLNTLLFYSLISHIYTYRLFFVRNLMPDSNKHKISSINCSSLFSFITDLNCFHPDLLRFSHTEDYKDELLLYRVF